MGILAFTSQCVKLNSSSIVAQHRSTLSYASPNFIHSFHKPRVMIPSNNTMPSLSRASASSFLQSHSVSKFQRQSVASSHNDSVFLVRAQNSSAAGAEPEPPKKPSQAVEDDPEAFSLLNRLSIATPVIVTSALPAFLLFFKNIIAPSPIASSIMPIIIALTFLVPDLASSSAFEFTNTKIAMESAMKRKALFKRARPVIFKFVKLIAMVWAMDLVGFYLAASSLVKASTSAVSATTAFAVTDMGVIAGASVVIVAQMLFHFFAKVTVSDDGSMKEVKASSQRSVVAANAFALVLLLSILVVSPAYKGLCSLGFATLIILYFGIKKILYLLAKFAIS